VSQLTELDEHRACGELDAGVEGDMVWIAYDCGVAGVTLHCPHFYEALEECMKSSLMRQKFPHLCVT
jgi:hypothetical protein